MPQTPDFSKYLDAGTDFVALTRTQARAQARELVSQGQLAQNQVQGFVDGLVEESRRRTDFFMDIVRQEIQRQVQSVGIATKDDLVKLEAKLAKQTKATKKSSGGTKTSTKSSPKKSADKKAAKKTGAKKSGAKKAAGKKKSSKSTARAAAS